MVKVLDRKSVRWLICLMVKVLDVQQHTSTVNSINLVLIIHCKQ